MAIPMENREPLPVDPASIPNAGARMIPVPIDSNEERSDSSVDPS
jgi:hypothetical protein